MWRRASLRLEKDSPRMDWKREGGLGGRGPRPILGAAHRRKQDPRKNVHSRLPVFMGIEMRDVPVVSWGHKA